MHLVLKARSTAPPGIGNVLVGPLSPRPKTPGREEGTGMRSLPGASASLSADWWSETGGRLDEAVGTGAGS